MVRQELQQQLQEVPPTPVPILDEAAWTLPVPKMCSPITMVTFSRIPKAQERILFLRAGGPARPLQLEATRLVVQAI